MEIVNMAQMDMHTRHCGKYVQCGSIGQMASPLIRP